MPSQALIQGIIYNRVGKVKTPTKAAVRALVWYTRQNSILCPVSQIARDFNFSNRSINRIIAPNSNLQRLANTNKENVEPSVRRAPRKITCSDAAAIADELDASSFDDNHVHGLI
jgi:hypothetical protein